MKIYYFSPTALPWTGHSTQILLCFVFCYLKQVSSVFNSARRPRLSPQAFNHPSALVIEAKIDQQKQQTDHLEDIF